MTSFQIYCESCDTDSTIQIQDKKKHADFCPVCGTELEELNVSENDNVDEDEWMDKLIDESLEDMDDWK